MVGSDRKSGMYVTYWGVLMCELLCMFPYQVKSKHFRRCVTVNMTIKILLGDQPCRCWVKNQLFRDLTHLITWEGFSAFIYHESFRSYDYYFSPCPWVFLNTAFWKLKVSIVGCKIGMFSAQRILNLDLGFSQQWIWRLLSGRKEYFGGTSCLHLRLHLHLLSLKQAAAVSSKCWYISTRLHSNTSQKTVILIPC
jgi:hypothetical protein